jgi:hypothetical protein
MTARHALLDSSMTLELQLYASSHSYTVARSLICAFSPYVARQSAHLPWDRTEDSQPQGRVILPATASKLKRAEFQRVLQWMRMASNEHTEDVHLIMDPTATLLDCYNILAVVAALEMECGFDNVIVHVLLGVFQTKKLNAAVVEMFFGLGIARLNECLVERVALFYVDLQFEWNEVCCLGKDFEREVGKWVPAILERMKDENRTKGKGFMELNGLLRL